MAAWHLQWICFYGISIGFLWDFHGISMIFLDKLDPPALWDAKNFGHLVRNDFSAPPAQTISRKFLCGKDHRAQDYTPHHVHLWYLQISASLESLIPHFGILPDLSDLSDLFPHPLFRSNWAVPRDTSLALSHQNLWASRPRTITADAAGWGWDWLNIKGHHSCHSWSMEKSENQGRDSTAFSEQSDFFQSLPANIELAPHTGPQTFIDSLLSQFFGYAFQPQDRTVKSYRNDHKFRFSLFCG